MPRKKTKALQRDIPKDRKYHSELVQRLINKTMKHGKKQLAEKVVYAGMADAAKKVKSDDPLAVLEQAVKNVAPKMEVRSRRVGGANYQIPYEVKGLRQTHLTLTWILEAARTREGTSFDKRLGAELADAYNETGTAMKKKEDTHKMADANRAFAHFARF